MAHITLFAQPNKDEPYIVLSRDIEASYTVVQNLQGSKCLTDIGASLFESIKALDNGVKVRGEDVGNDRYVWRMTFYGAGCEVVASPVHFKAQDPACMGYAIQITATGSLAAMSNIFQTLLLNIKRNPFDITDWDAFTNKTGVSRDTVVNTWNNAMFPSEEDIQTQETTPEGKAALEAKPSEKEIRKRIQSIETIRKRKVVEESSKEGDIKKLVSLGIECFNNGDFETAIFHWQRILEIEPQHQDTLKAIEVARNKIKERRSKIESSQVEQLKGDTLKKVEAHLRSTIEAEVNERSKQAVERRIQSEVKKREEREEFLKGIIKRLEDEIKSRKEAEEKARERVKILSTEIIERFKDEKNNDQETENRINRYIEDMNTRLEDVTEQKAKLESQLEALNRKLADAEAERSLTEINARKLEVKIEEKDSMIKVLQEGVNNLQAEFESQRKSGIAIESSLQDDKRHLKEDYERKIEGLQKSRSQEIERLKAELDEERRTKIALQQVAKEEVDAYKKVSQEKLESEIRNRNHLEDMIKEFKAQLENERQIISKTKDEGMQQLDAQLKEAQGKLENERHRTNALEEKLASLEGTNQDLSAEVSRLQALDMVMNGKVSSLEEENTALSKKYDEQLSNLNTQDAQAYKTLQAQAAAKDDEIKSLGDKVEWLDKESKTKEDTLKAKIADLEQELADRQSEIAPLKQSLESTATALEAERKAKFEYETRSKEDFDAFVKDAGRKIEEEGRLRQELEVKLKQSQDSMSHNGDVMAHIGALKIEHDLLAAQLEKEKARALELERESNEALEALGRVNKDYEALHSQHEQLDQELNIWKLDNEKMSSELKTLRELHQDGTPEHQQLRMLSQELAQKYDQLAAEYKRLAQEDEQIRIQSDALRAQSEQINIKNEQIAFENKTLNKALREKTEEVTAALEALKLGEQSESGRITKIQELEELMAGKSQESESIKQELELAKQYCDSAAKEIESYKVALEKVNALNQESGQSNANLAQEHQAALVQIAELKAGVEAAMQAKADASREAEGLRQALESARTEREASEQSKANMNLEQQAAVDRIEDLNSQLKASTLRLGEANVELEAQKNEVSRLSALLLDMNSKQDALVSRFETQVDEFKRGMERADMHSELIDRGIEYFKTGLYKEALESWTEVLRDEPGNEQIRSAIELARSNIQKLTGIEKKEQDLSAIEAYSLEGERYFTNKDYPRAIEAWKNILKIDPDHHDTIEAIRQAREMITQTIMPTTQPVRETVPVGMTAEESAPAEAQPYKITGPLQKEEGVPYKLVPSSEDMPLEPEAPDEEAETEAEAPMSIYEAAPDVDVELGAPDEEPELTAYDGSEAQQGQPEQSEQGPLDHAEEDIRDLIASKRFAEAEGQVDALLEHEPNRVSGWALAGEMFAAQERLKEAQACYDHALEIKPNYSRALTGKGIVIQSLGDNKGAMALFDAALEIDPKDADAWGYRGLIYFTQGKPEMALDSFDRSLSSRPDNIDILTLRALTLQQLGREEMASVAYEKVLAIDPNNETARAKLDEIRRRTKAGLASRLFA